MSQVESEAKQTYWCNFCDFRTEDREEYLAHSCAEELEKKGHRKEAPGSGTHCG